MNIRIPDTRWTRTVSIYIGNGMAVLIVDGSVGAVILFGFTLWPPKILKGWRYEKSALPVADQHRGDA